MVEGTKLDDQTAREVSAVGAGRLTRDEWFTHPQGTHKWIVGAPQLNRLHGPSRSALTQEQKVGVPKSGWPKNWTINVISSEAELPV